MSSIRNALTMDAPSRHVLPAILWTAIFLLLAPFTLAQTVSPSNATTDLLPASSSPRFLLNGSEVAGLPEIRLAPLTDAAATISKGQFLSFSLEGHLLGVDSQNVQNIPNNAFAYVSCDNIPSTYSGYVDPSVLMSFILAGAGSTKIFPLAVILYSQYANHCNFTINSNPAVQAIFTTVDPMIAASIAALQLAESSPGNTKIVPDLNSYTNSSNNNGYGGSDQGILGPSPTTAVAMIILYAITGVITALFIIIIITGAIRAHRHPERYGPRARAGGRGSQSRAKGIGRAMLETLPLVKFGDNTAAAPVKHPSDADVEMTPGTNTNPVAADDVTTREAPGVDPNTEGKLEQQPEEDPEELPKDSETMHDEVTQATDGVGAATAKPSSTNEDSSLGCSICTEDFNQGEDVRVLPCDHKFHPACVDPWLLNVSGTCPLCRIDLRGEGREDDETTEPRFAPDGVDLPPPLGEQERSDSVATAFGPERRESMPSLIHMRNAGTREERIAALRRLRAATLNQRIDEGDTEQRQGRASRLRDRFHIRTTRAVARSVAASNANTAASRAAEAPPPRRGSYQLGPHVGSGMHGAAALSMLHTTGPATPAATQLRPLRDVYRFGRRSSARPTDSTNETSS